MTVIVKSSIRMTLLSAVYLVALSLLGLVLFTVVTNAHIIWQTENQLGHPLSCAEAYQQREINAYFYPERRFQGDILYFYSLIAPIILLGFIGLTAVLGVSIFTPEQGARFKWGFGAMIASGIILVIGLLAYSPIIYTIACATE